MTMDVVWLKRDVRIRDHGPLAEVGTSRNRVMILYLYEPDQLSESSVHGSHVNIISEGLQNLDKNLATENGSKSNTDEISSSQFKCLTVCHATIIDTLEAIHGQFPIARLLAHEETGHYKSYQRDVKVRRWCLSQKICFLEFQQSGAKRCLRNRDDFSKHLNTFLSKPMHPTPDLENLRTRLVTHKDIKLCGKCDRPIDLQELTEIPEEHRVDRLERQKGGESEALGMLESFLMRRGTGYSSGISSPNSAWSTCSRLSIYLSWGHISLRYVVHTLYKRQETLREWKKMGKTLDPRWLRSLSAFSSRLHWRAHFIQKLECEPMIEKQDLCPAYQHLRRQEGDWNEQHFKAWATGKTGFPFVDACMRCLHRHGWINFRMRAMLVSFATHNLWLDWKRIAPHLARLFLDYEPGIHYPQLQMQAGTTGINAMRVYNVTKQGRDQDSNGVFIKKYVPELCCVPKEFIHEPWKLSQSMQKELQVVIKSTPPCETSVDLQWYPSPIINEQEQAKIAKSKIAVVRNLDSSKQAAQKVYEKHGSRNAQRDNMNNNRKSKALSSNAVKDISQQATIETAFKKQVDNKNFLSQKRPKQLITNPRKKQANNWTCSKCTFLNTKAIAVVCEMCATIRI